VTTPLYGPDAVRRGIARQFLKRGATVENAMTIVGPVLDWYDDEIRRLSAACEEEECAAILGEPPPGALL
jgi:hypothetical protein